MKCHLIIQGELKKLPFATITELMLETYYSAVTQLCFGAQRLPFCFLFPWIKQ